MLAAPLIIEPTLLRVRTCRKLHAVQVAGALGGGGLARILAMIVNIVTLTLLATLVASAPTPLVMCPNVQSALFHIRRKAHAVRAEASSDRELVKLW